MSTDKTCRVRRLRKDDLPAVAYLEAQIFPDAWSLKSLEQTFELPTTLALGAWQVSDPQPAGYLLFTQVPPEGEILRIAVQETDRRMGIGSRLLDELSKICAREGIHKIMLEVRSDNAPAVQFYEKAGFVRDGIRTGYYQDPEGDALLMSRQV